MPAIRSTVSCGNTATGGYPKLMKGRSGSVWLLTGTSPVRGKRGGPLAQGVIVHLSATPQKAGKHYVGYSSQKMVESDMTPFNGSVTLALGN